MTKEYIIEAYEKLKKKLGKQPSMKELLKHTSVTHRSLLKVGFRTYSELVELMGDTPKEFINPPRPEEEFFIIYGNATRQLNKVPSTVDWEFHSFLPNVKNYSIKFNLKKWTDMRQLFLDYAKGKDEWKDILHLIPIKETSKRPALQVESGECYVYLMYDTKTLCYKIGISNEPEWREKTLQSEKPSIKRIAAKKFVNRRIAANIEKALHESYSHRRQRGEWFNLDDEDVDEIKATLND